MAATDRTGDEPPFSTDPSFAEEADRDDPLAFLRERFNIPRRPDGSFVHYFCGNSLGLQPRAAGAAVNQVLEDWATLAVEGHFEADPDWYSYHEVFRESAARLVGAEPDEVVMMNSLTANLHLMMVSFYRPTAERPCILIEDGAFPSDTYAVKSQIRFHGLDPEKALILARPAPGEETISREILEELLEKRGHEIALVLLSGVQFRTGQLFDIEHITRTAAAKGCTVGWDLAHAAGNVPLALHDWGVDFAVWCNYKYLNAGPGAVGGCFVHRRHVSDASLPRFAGWWGNDPASRFSMQLIPEFVPVSSADGWQLSNPQILSLAPLRASLDLFDEAGMAALRQKSVRLTGYLEFLLDELARDTVRILTPREPEARGCQLSLVLTGPPEPTLARLKEAGMVCDFRPPDVIRVAPVPMYNTFVDVRELARALSSKTP